MSKAHIRSSSIERARVAVDQLVENPKNPRNHPQDQIDRLAASLKKFGQPKPILARKADLVVVAGHGVLQAAKLAGFKDVDVLLWDVDAATADAYMLADNRHGDLSTHDPDRVAALLRDLEQDDYLAVGFSDDEVAGLLGDLETGAIDVDEVETALVQDRAWVSIRCPLSAQAEMLDRLKAAMAGMPDVEVELGTIAVS